MQILLDQTGKADVFEDLLTAVEAEAEVRSILVLACDANGFTKEEVDPVLLRIEKPVFGGVFPEIMHGTKKLEKGTIVAGLTKSADIRVIPGLSDSSADYEGVLEEVIPEAPDAKTMFVFVDGLSQRIGALVDSLFSILGLEVNYIGGGAGSLSFEREPVLFTNEGLIQDAAVLALTDIESGIGVSHGWKDVAGPFRVTESDRNEIKTLDWRPAFEVYREVVEQRSGREFTDDNFFDIAKGFPFGISKLGSEKIVRDPLSVHESGSLVCVGEVPQDVFIHILEGNTESLVGAANQAIDLARGNLAPGVSPEFVLFIDCISRVLFMGEEFPRELNAVSDESIPLIGALTLGEIANSGKDYLEFYNKTSVVGVLG